MLRKYGIPLKIKENIFRLKWSRLVSPFKNWTGNKMSKLIKSDHLTLGHKLTI
jgi:hypothetical protein